MRCFSVIDKHTWLNKRCYLTFHTTWLLIFWLEVANKKPVFAKPAITHIERFC